MVQWKEVPGLELPSIVPPVASKSSTIKTLLPDSIASWWTSTRSVPYSRSYSTPCVGPGSLPALRTGIKPFPKRKALRLGKGFIPVRKAGKLPGPTHGVEYDLEYGTDLVEVHQDAIESGSRVLMVDDLLATGGTMEGSSRPGTSFHCTTCC